MNGSFRALICKKSAFAGSPRRSALKTLGVVVAVGGVLAAGVWAVFGVQEQGVLELHSTPPNASVSVNGRRLSKVTPLLLPLPAEKHQVVVFVVGHRSVVFTADIQAGGETTRKHVTLPLMRGPERLDIRIDVQPVAADITVDRDLYVERRTLELANVDPAVAHRITLEAKGYEKVEHRIEPGRLKDRYRYVLQPSSGAHAPSRERAPVAATLREASKSRWRRAASQTRKRKNARPSSLVRSSETSAMRVFRKKASEPRVAVPKVGVDQEVLRVGQFVAVPKLGVVEGAPARGASSALPRPLGRGVGQDSADASGGVGRMMGDW